MQTYRTSFMSATAFLMLLCSTCIVSRKATACPDTFGGPTSFTAAPGSSHTQTWTYYCHGCGVSSAILQVSITGGLGVFTLGRLPNYSDSTTFTITFTPDANATGTFKATLNCPCGRTYELVGTVAASGVANTLPSNASLTITPNPATDYVNIISSGVRTAEIGIYDLLGKEIASSKTTNWKWDASSSPRRATGSYIVRLTGESIGGDPFIISRRIIISR